MALANIAREAGIGARKEFAAFDVKTPPTARAFGIKAAAVPTRYYVAVSTPRGRAHEGRNLAVAAIAKEVAGRIVGYRIYTQR
jgi:hypothetical protein